MNETTHLAGYEILEPLYESTRSLVYRGLRSRDRAPVVIKVLRALHPHFNDLVRFRNQYVITSHLDHPNILKPLALERCGHSYALVMPDEGSMALSAYWQPSLPDLHEFLNVAIQLAEALRYLNQQRIIHKDIKPANLLIHPQTQQIQLIDFSIASLLPKEQQQLNHSRVLEGTPAYISPEQTGWMNRGVDYRSDFYSLGATFFKLLTGELPFRTKDSLELIHCHIAKPPVFPTPSSVPLALQRIILKLMAKNAEERYQSALGLKYDLERCLQQLERSGEMTLFKLGTRDICDRFLIPEKLYGREAEVQTLLDAFDRISSCSISTSFSKESQETATPAPTRCSELVLVAGQSGIGKTAIINEIYKPIVKQRGYFIKGKFDQFQRSIPFSAFVQAFRDLMRQLLSESDADLANWKANILKAVGNNAQAIIEVIPELERIIGPQPPVLELSGSAMRNRFKRLFGEFVQVFATQAHPLTIFLDDLQWADFASLNLIESLLRDRNYLLLLGAYRNNEVSLSHPLRLSLAKLEKNRAPISTISLEPLPFDCINQLIAETLNCHDTLAQPLTELVHKKAQGNPFFTTQVLKRLREDELIEFNADLGYWQCDLANVRDAVLTDDVVEFVAGRLQHLPAATQNILKLAACIGNQFDLQTLAVICQKLEEEVAIHLWFALQEELVLPLNESYKFFQGKKQIKN